MRPISDLSLWRVLAAVVDYGSISLAARMLNMSIARTSRALAQLELQIGRPLVDRSSRPLRATAFGEAVLPKLRAVLADWDAFEHFLNDAGTRRTRIRLSTPAGIGRFYLNAQISEYYALNPTVVIETSVEGTFADVLQGRVDVAFLPFTPEDQALRIFPAMNAFTLPLASPTYLAANGRPQSPEELIHHTGILKNGLGFPTADLLIRRKERRLVSWGRGVSHNDMLNVKDAVVRGLGLALDLPLGLVLDEIRRGELVQVLDGWHRTFWRYSIVTRREDGPGTPIGRFALWYARRATEEIDRRRNEGFALLGVDPQDL